MDEAEAHLTAALERHQAMDAPQWLTHSEHDLAALLVERNRPGDAGAAAVLLDACVTRALALGLDAVGRRAGALARVAEGQRHQRGAAAHGLTPREREVVALLTDGRSNREIAGTLVLSERTVESHVQNVLTKLGFTSRTQIATWAVGKDGGGPR